MERFILTMWYVNLAFSPYREMKIGGFILTMWYVNVGMGVMGTMIGVGSILAKIIEIL